MSVEWRESLAVGVPRIDEMHKELFRRFDILMTAINEGKGSAEVLNVLVFLDDYTVSHFRDEETFMADNSYAHLPLHREEHQQFCRDLGKLKQRIATEGATQQNILLTSRTLLRWLVQHICTTDKALVDTLTGRTRRVIAVPMRPADPPAPKAPEQAPPEEDNDFPFFYEDDVTS